MVGRRSEWKIAPADAQVFVTERFRNVGSVETLRQGLWSSTYGFRLGNEDLVIRFGSIRDDFDHDARVGRVAPASLPVPTIVEIGEALGGWYAVSRRLRGRHLDAMSAPEVRRALPSLFTTLDVLREIDLSDVAGFGFWDADGNGRMPSWRSELLTIDRDDPGWARPGPIGAMAAAAFERGYARLRELAGSCPEERHLVHSDLLHWNVLVEDERVTGLVDWGSSIYGDFLHDIAWLTFWWPWYPEWKGIDVTHEVRAHYARTGLVVPSFGERLRCYELRIGLGNLNWYLSRGDDVNLERVAKRIDQLCITDL